MPTNFAILGSLGNVNSISKIVITGENDENMIVSPFENNCLIDVNEN